MTIFLLEWVGPASIILSSTAAVAITGAVLRIMKKKENNKTRNVEQATVDTRPETITLQGPESITLHNLISELTEGDFSHTYAASAAGVTMTVKIYSYEHIEPERMARVRDEQIVMEMLKDNPHPYIVDVLLVHAAASSLKVGLRPHGDSIDQMIYVIGPFPAPTARTYVMQVCEALDHVHSMGIIHLDLKPENVLVDHEQHVKLTGFDYSIPRETGTVTLRGTPEYMAPEMMLARPFTKKVDYWALGCLTCEMLAGETPFTSDSIAGLVRLILHDPITFPAQANLGGHEVAFMAALLDRDPETRIGSLDRVRFHAWFQA